MSLETHAAQRAHVHTHIGRVGLRVQPIVPEVAEPKRDGAPRRHERPPARGASHRRDCLLLPYLIRANDEERARLARELGRDDGAQLLERELLRRERPARLRVRRIKVEAVELGGGGDDGRVGTGTSA